MVALVWFAAAEGRAAPADRSGEAAGGSVAGAGGTESSAGVAGGSAVVGGGTERAAGAGGSAAGGGATAGGKDSPVGDGAGPKDSGAGAGPKDSGGGGEPLKPPRVDGTYVGGSLVGGASFVRVNNFPTPDPLVGGGGTVRVGQVIYPWMSIGVEIAFNGGVRAAEPRQRILQGAFLVDLGFYPIARRGLSLRAGFGAGGGAVREAGRPARSGFGGAVFTGAARYEFFPGAARRRPKRGGGFSIGPELGWIGYMPAARGRPMAHTVYLGLYLGFYFGS